MKVTAKITKNFTDAGKLKAFATVCLADAFLVTGVRVVECEKGITVFMPSMKDKEDEYRDVCFPIKPELRSQINTAVLNAYDASLKRMKWMGNNSQIICATREVKRIGGYTGTSYRGSPEWSSCLY